MQDTRRRKAAADCCQMVRRASWRRIKHKNATQQCELRHPAPSLEDVSLGLLTATVEEPA